MDLFLVFMLLAFFFIAVNSLFYLLFGSEFNENTKADSSPSMTHFSNSLIVLAYLLLAVWLNHFHPFSTISFPPIQILPMAIWKAIWAAFIPGSLIFCIAGGIADFLSKKLSLGYALTSFRLSISLAFIFYILVTISLQ